MYYLPTDLLNKNYTYTYNNNYYTVRTNNNCYTNYNTQYCDCYNVFQNNNYLVSNSFACSSPNSQYLISYDKFTSDFNYRIDILNIYLLFIIIVMFTFYFPISLYKAFRKRVKL